ncbi:hypothetical protein ACFY93_24975 [Streptomyces sp. NPDC008313]|uniref:hypothetical protein n=1 Tax=Streptomyces sp. NPDC008313 TaxID=3364826 RepID=UPI0036E1C044
MTDLDLWAHGAFLIALLGFVAALFTGLPLWLLLPSFLVMVPSVVVMWIEKPKRRP